MVYITRKASFSASHRLHNPDFSDEENRRIYGKCNNPNGHGHNYTLEVTIKGKVDDNTGMIIDLKELKDIINENLIDKVDHKNLNFDVGFMQDVIPTVENMIVQFWNILNDALPEDKCELYELKLRETEKNIAVYRGE